MTAHELVCGRGQGDGDKDVGMDGDGEEERLRGNARARGHHNRRQHWRWRVSTRGAEVRGRVRRQRTGAAADGAAGADPRKLNDTCVLHDSAVNMA